MDATLIGSNKSRTFKTQAVLPGVSKPLPHIEKKRSCKLSPKDISLYSTLFQELEKEKNPRLSKTNGCQIGFFIVHCAPKMMSMDPKLPPVVALVSLLE